MNAKLYYFRQPFRNRSVKLAKELTQEAEIITVQKDETIEAVKVEHIYFLSEQRDKIKLLEKVSRLDHSKSTCICQRYWQFNCII